jgi:hypothetical protein
MVWKYPSNAPSRRTVRAWAQFSCTQPTIIYPGQLDVTATPRTRFEHVDFRWVQLSCESVAFCSIVMQTYIGKDSNRRLSPSKVDTRARQNADTW